MSNPAAELVAGLGRLGEGDFVAALLSALERRPEFASVHDELVTLIGLSGATSSIREALTASRPNVVTATTLLSDHLPESGLSSGVLQQLRIEAEARRRILRTPLLDASGVAELLGSGVRNSRDVASALRRSGRLLGLDVGGRTLFPAFQVDAQAGKLRAPVARVNLLLGAKGDPWGVASWWVSPNARLAGGVAPAALALAGNEEVLAALAEDLLDE